VVPFVALQSEIGSRDLNSSRRLNTMATKKKAAKKKKKK
jgi:hypothetical protein